MSWNSFCPSARNAQMPDSRNQRTAPSAASESFRRHARARWAGANNALDKPLLNKKNDENNDTNGSGSAHAGRWSAGSILAIRRD
jgi:hypothetical protein